MTLAGDSPVGSGWANPSFKLMSRYLASNCQNCQYGKQLNIYCRAKEDIGEHVSDKMDLP